MIDLLVASGIMRSKLKKALLVNFDLVKNAAIRRSNNFYRFWSHEKWQKNSISWSQNHSPSCFDLMKFNLLTPTRNDKLKIKIENDNNYLSVTCWNEYLRWPSQDVLECLFVEEVMDLFVVKKIKMNFFFIFFYFNSPEYWITTKNIISLRCG